MATIEIKNFVSITDIRRTLKLLRSEFISNKKVVSKLDALVHLITKASTVKSDTADRIKREARNKCDLPSVGKSLAVLNDIRSTAQHMYTLLVNEYPQSEYIVSKVTKEVVTTLNDVGNYLKDNSSKFNDILVAFTPKSHKMAVSLLDQVLTDLLGTPNVTTFLTNQEDKFIYTTYFTYHDVADVNGYIYCSYVIALTSVIDDKTVTYLNSLNKFHEPGSFNLEHKLDKAGVVEQVRGLLATMLIKTKG